MSIFTTSIAPVKPATITLAPVALVDDRTFESIPGGDREYADASEWPIWTDYEVPALTDDSPAEVEAIGPDDFDREWAASNLNRDWHTDETDPASDGVLASDLEWVRFMEGYTEARECQDLLDAGYAAL